MSLIVREIIANSQKNIGVGKLTNRSESDFNVIY